MSWLPDRIARSSRTVTLALVFLAVPTTLVHAQFYGYGYGMPAYGYGFPGYGFGGLGYPGLAYGPGIGYGFPGYGYGYGAGGYYGGPVIGGPGPYGFVPVGGPGPGVYNPYFGLGLTPLGVESALTERYLLGRGTTRYSGGYGTIPPSGSAVPGAGYPRP